jgi:perosamine synthetase
MSGDKLAIHGGPRAVDARRPQQVARIKRGLLRSFDLMKMLPLTMRGVTSLQSGEGIVRRFETAFAEMVETRYALAMNSGTAAIHSAYFAVGVGPGTEVIVPAYTWHATATPILQCGAVPVFCEIDPRTLVLDPDQVERRVNERTRAICVLHPWGHPAPMDRFLEIAERHGLYVIEDCSHAHGATYRGKPVGSWGHVGCFSLQGSKTVEGGEAGVATTDDPMLIDRMLLLGHNHLLGHGSQKANTFADFPDVSLGVKYRPHTAAMYLAYASLRRLPARNARAARVWEWLCDELEGTPGVRPIPTVEGGTRGGYYSYILEYQGEDFGGPPTEVFVEALAAEGAPAQLDQYRDGLLHHNPVFATLDRSRLGGGCWDPTRPWQENVVKVDLPVTERIARRLVRFPIVMQDYPEATVRECGRAVKKVLRALIPESSGVSAPATAAVGR